MQTNVIKKKDGQTLILSTVLIGGALLSASAIAGFVLFFQIRQAGDAESSTAAFYAADTGMESAIYCYYRQNFSTENIDAFCDTSGDTQKLIGGAGSCINPSDCKNLGHFDVKLSCFTDPANKTSVISCMPAANELVSPVKGIYIISDGSTTRAQRVLDYTIITASGN
ncbi:MAG: hypothetical protein WC842_01910 [Candidatus Paceibacterota bacterium]|jgi:hypothetical protein